MNDDHLTLEAENDSESARLCQHILTHVDYLQNASERIHLHTLLIEDMQKYSDIFPPSIMKYFNQQIEIQEQEIEQYCIDNAIVDKTKAISIKKVHINMIQDYLSRWIQINDEHQLSVQSKHEVNIMQVWNASIASNDEFFKMFDLDK